MVIGTMLAIGSVVKLLAMLSTTVTLATSIGLDTRKLNSVAQIRFGGWFVNMAIFHSVVSTSLATWFLLINLN
jgi:hypothetical protein